MEQYGGNGIGGGIARTNKNHKAGQEKRSATKCHLAYTPVNNGNKLIIP